MPYLPDPPLFPARGSETSCSALLCLAALAVFLPLALFLGCTAAQPAAPARPGVILPPGARILVPKPDYDIPPGTEVFSFGDGKHYVEERPLSP